MKGLLRGLRYISQIFDDNKEPEMQIGFPTDVKHVAHIGWDGPSASKPSWMNDYQSAPELSSANSSPMEDVKSRSILPFSPVEASSGEKQKRRSRRQPNASPINSPNRKGSEGSKHSRRQTTTGIESPLNASPKTDRRNRSTNNSMDSPSRDPCNARGTRRLQASPLGVESPNREQPSIPKQSRGRKSKDTSRLKEKKSSSATLPSPDRGHQASGSMQMQGAKGCAGHLSSVLELYNEEDRVGRKNRELRVSDIRC